MQFWTPILIILLAGLSWFIWSTYRRQLLNKAVWIKRINPSTLKSVGDIKVNEDLIQVKFLRGTKTFSFRQIEQIKAYALTDWGLEEYEQVDILFDTADKITFNSSLQEHRNIVQAIASEIGIESNVWTWGFLPHLGDKMCRELVFEKNKSR